MPKTFYNWTDAVKELAERIRKITPLAGENIITKQEPGGVKIHGTKGGGEGGNAYEGYFKILISGSTLSVIDGSDPESEIAGYVIIGNIRQSVVVYEEDFSGENTTIYIYIETIWEDNEYKTEIKSSLGSLTGAENGTDIRQVGYATIVDGVLSIGAQTLYGEHVISGRWVGEYDGT